MSVDMNHLKFLDAVADSDAATIRRKEATYRGSWKAAGGISAWFMFRRNMDRLIEMMRPPADVHGFSIVDLDDCISQAKREDAEAGGDITLDWSVVEYLRDHYMSQDIFKKIEENPLGQDGTVLAVLRDMRRYALLVEAEMVSQGVTTPEENAAEWGRETVDNDESLKGVLERLLGFGEKRGTLDLYSFSALLLGVPRDEAKKRVIGLIYGVDMSKTGGVRAPDAETAASHLGSSEGQSTDTERLVPRSVRKAYGSDDTLLYISRLYRHKGEGGEFIVRLLTIHPNGEVEIDAGQWRQIVAPQTLSALLIEQDDAVIGPVSSVTVVVDVPGSPVQRTPEDGAQHASLYPWAVSMDWRLKNGFEPGSENEERFDHWWYQKAPGLWVLNAAVFAYPGITEEVHIPDPVLHIYRLDNTYGFWIVDIANCPADAREWFPALPKEQNSKERAERPNWQQALYHWQDGPDKWVLAPQHASWARD